MWPERTRTGLCQRKDFAGGLTQLIDDTPTVTAISPDYRVFLEIPQVPCLLVCTYIPISTYSFVGICVGVSFIMSQGSEPSKNSQTTPNADFAETVWRGIGWGLFAHCICTRRSCTCTEFTSTSGSLHPTVHIHFQCFVPLKSTTASNQSPGNMVWPPRVYSNYTL